MTDFNVNTTAQEVVERWGTTIRDKTIIITGPSPRSLGAEVAISLAKGSNPSRIILAGRSQSKISPVLNEIQKLNPSVAVSFVELDLANNASVCAAAHEIKTITSTVDVLLNCAGIMAVREFSTTADDVEIHFAANHLGHFLLTNLLANELARTKGRVVNVTSMAYTLAEVDTDDPNFNGGKAYNAWVAYARSKTANILFTLSLTQEYKNKDITAVAADPGMVFETNLQVNSGVDHDFMLQGFALATERNGGVEPPHAPQVSLQQGAATLLVGMLQPSYSAPSTVLLHECAPMPVLPYATDASAASNLWKLSERLTGRKFVE